MRRTLVSLGIAIALSVSAAAADWMNNGGNNARNGQSPEIGPYAADLLWSNTADYSIISWHPFILGDRVFTIREAGFPTSGGSANDALIAYDLETGTELWRTTLSFGGDTGTEWIAWCGGARDGKVYASRSSNQQPQPIKAFDAATGTYLWTSVWQTEAWAHDGIVFAPNGDLIVGEFRYVTRINHNDGTTVWNTPRTGSVSGNCGAAATATAVYIDEAAPGGNILTRLDMATGARLYSSPLMAGFTNQNSPFVSADGGTVYFSRSQNNPPYDNLFAFTDDGAQFIPLWNRPVRWTTSHEHAIAADGSIYTFLPTNEFVRLDPANGNVLDTAGVLSPIGTSNLSPKTAVDINGNVYVSNGWASTPASDGRLWAFNAGLSVNLFTLNLDRQNSGGPAIGNDGTMLVADRSGVYAYRSTWTDLGSALAGATGEPVLLGQGELKAQQVARLKLKNALPNSVSALVLGLSNAGTPFKGGTLVPATDVVVFGLPTGSAGELPLTAQVPAAMAAGVPLYFQYWIVDPAGPWGFAASNAVTVTTP
ncbi:MAG: PQQ-binding-like beta-propeller repeat protein [Planctomycetota bacterium]